MKKLSQKSYTVKHRDSGYDKHLLVKQFELPHGAQETFILEDSKNSVQIFALKEDQTVLCVRQFRPGPEKLELELPGGALDKNEEPLKAAERELLEETGHKGSLTYLGSLPYSPYSTGMRHMFMAVNCVRVAKLDLDPNEFLTLEEIPLQSFRKLMQKGHVRGTDLSYMALDSLGLL